MAEVVSEETFRGIMAKLSEPDRKTVREYINNKVKEASARVETRPTSPAEDSWAEVERRNTYEDRLERLDRYGDSGEDPLPGR